MPWRLAMLPAVKQPEYNGTLYVYCMPILFSSPSVQLSSSHRSSVGVEPLQRFFFLLQILLLLSHSLSLFPFLLCLYVCVCVCLQCLNDTIVCSTNIRRLNHGQLYADRTSSANSNYTPKHS